MPAMYRLFSRMLLLPIMLAISTAMVDAKEILRMATTTSTENSGLLDLLNPPFESKYNTRIHVIAVGTGKALRLAENGDVDIVFVHAPDAEIKFINDGFGINRTAVMHNDFILLGHSSDPAAVKSSKDIYDALTKIATTGSTFISRGDDSGTHKKEKQLWDTAGIQPKGNWYLRAGQGMGKVINITFEKKAYTLSDRGTFMYYRSKIDLEIVRQGDKELHNPYHVILVNPAKHSHVKVELGKKYIDYITSEQGQRIIGDYRIQGEQLFYPDVIKEN